MPEPESLKRIIDRKAPPKRVEIVDPKDEEELHDRVCTVAKKIGASVDVLYSDTSGNLGILLRWLQEIEPRVESMAKMGNRLVPENRGEDVRAFLKCYHCQDTGYIPGKPTEPSGFDSFDFCGECILGKGARVGYWSKRLWPGWSRSKRPQQTQVSAMKRYCEAKDLEYTAFKEEVKNSRKRAKGERDDDI